MSLVGDMVGVDANPDATGVVREEDAVEDSAEMDARVAAIMHLQQLQHKQEVMQLLEAHPVTNADTEFRMQLEELVRDHLNTCMALASCSTSDSSDSHHHLLELSAEQCHHHHHHHHQYHLVVENEEAEVNRAERESRENADNTSDLSHEFLRPKATGILNRWDERQNSEPTVRERQVREAELLALSSLHTVSTLDASFLQGSPSPRAESSVERPQRLSPLVQRWRELEGEQSDRETTSQLSDRTRTTGGETEVLENWTELTELDGEPESSILRSNDSDESSVPATTNSVETEVVMPESIPSSAQGSEETQASDQIESRAATEPPPEIETSGSNRSPEHHSQNEITQELDGERERVRQIVQRWMRESGVADSEPATENARTSSSSSRVEWLAEGERERVRQMAREWVQVSNFEARPTRPSSQRQQQAMHPLNSSVRQQQQLQGQQTTGQEAASLADAIRTQHSRIGWDDPRQREMILELLMRSEQERQRELVGISEHRTVSAFAHRNRLQSFLRGRFLRNGGGTDVERPPSSAAGEIGQLRQQRAVSGIREGFRFRLETIVRGQGNQGSSDGQRRQQEGPQTIQEPNGHMESPDGGEFQDHPAPRRAQWTHDLQSLEDATAYNMELRELLARQSVTTVLASDFRDRLDQLIRSFIHTQGRTPQPWDMTRPRQAPPPPPTLQAQRSQQGPVDRERRVNVSQATQLVIPPPPPPPPHPLWREDLMVSMVLQQPSRGAWPRPAPRRPAEMEWETTSRALRADVTVLQRGMNEIREMMESSIQMQIELQRSIRQEISGALQRMYIGKEIPDEALSGSRWTSVKKGTCCICCDKQIDCLLYRCGHMSTCVKCADELHKNSGRCPMCRASIVEVVRAFTVT